VVVGVVDLQAQTIADVVIAGVFEGNRVAVVDIVGQFGQPVAQVILIYGVGIITQRNQGPAGKLIVFVFGQDAVAVVGDLCQPREGVVFLGDVAVVGISQLRAQTPVVALVADETILQIQRKSTSPLSNAKYYFQG
jgi:hypothetical protein